MHLMHLFWFGICIKISNPLCDWNLCVRCWRSECIHYCTKEFNSIVGTKSREFPLHSIQTLRFRSLWIIVWFCSILTIFGLKDAQKGSGRDRERERDLRAFSCSQFRFYRYCEWKIDNATLLNISKWMNAETKIKTN